jgi:hypothetical protein
MPLVFGDVRPNLWQFPDLMPQWGKIASPQPRAATTALGWLERLHRVTFVRGDQRPVVLGVPRLTAPFPFRPGLLGVRFGVRMLRAGWKRRIVGRLTQPRFELGHTLGKSCDLRQQSSDNRLCLRRLPSDQFFRYSQRHAQDVAEIPSCAKSSFLNHAGV